MPKRAAWADLVDDSGDEMGTGTMQTCNNEEDERMPDGQVSPAASFCSTQFSWDDEMECKQNVSPFQFDGAQSSVPPMDWVQTATLPALFAAHAVIPVVNPPSIPTQGLQVTAETLTQCFSLVKHARTDPVKKRFLKQGSGDRTRQTKSIVKQKIATEAAARTLPEASEEDWQRRLEKRHNIVAAIKDTPEYLFLAANRAGARSSGLRTPRPNDRSVSKRQWEDQVHKWRTSLRNCYAENDQR